MEAISSSGYVVDTLEAVIWCINNTDGYKQAVIGAINLGDDTDTVGALTGALAGIIYGYGDIPKKWINKLQKSDYLKLIYTSFVKTMANLK
ncbi:MAG: ADP-ribosylglycohydrolase family protein [Bacilli bacterium]